MSFQVGDAVGDYEVIGILGAGGMGQVYKVRNVISDRVEAMKVLLPDLVSDPELADRFLREIKVLASLDHPNIASLHTALRAGDQIIMIMELVEGTTLEQMQEQGPLPLADGLRYISDSLDALGYAHEHGVIHRDIKPANIMLTNDGVIKLMDFGIAKAANDRKLTMTGTTMGSLYYMSPEQVKGITSLDPRSDLYSLGVTLYEVVTGQRPFQGDSDYAIMSAHLEKQPRPPLEMDPNVPAALNEIILRALAKSPDERFQTAAAFRRALESVRGEQPEVTRVAPRRAPPRAEPAAPEPFVRPAKSHRGLYVLAGSVLTIVILLAAGIQVANWRKTRAGGGPQGEPPPPVQEPAPAPVPVQDPPAVPPTPPPATPPPSEPASAPVSTTPPTRKVAVPPVPVAAPGTSTAQPPATAASPKQVTPPVAEPAPAPAAAVQTPAPAPSRNSAASSELRDHMVFLASRASTVRSGLANLERQQSRMGVGLRPDMAAANQRMDFLLKEAGAALASGDAAAAKRNADMAEREVEKLEKFLGK